MKKNHTMIIKILMNMKYPTLATGQNASAPRKFCTPLVSPTSKVEKNMINPHPHIALDPVFHT